MTRRLLIVAVMAVASLFGASRDADAAIISKWYVYPALQTSGIFDYGWHFDEGSAVYGARDYNFAGDEGATVRYRAKLARTSQYWMRWRFVHSGTYDLDIVTEVFVFNTWAELERTRMHYLHMCTRVANNTITNQIINSGQTVNVVVGTINGNCGGGNSHLHQSADFATGSRMFRVSYPSDACWSNTDDFTGTNLYQCPGSGYRTHNGVTGDAPCGAWNGSTWLVSGNVPEYECEEWSKENRSYTSNAFLGEWSG